MAEVVELKKKKPIKQRLVTVCWGGFQIKETTQHIAVGPNGCHYDPEAGLLSIDQGGDKLRFYPTGGVFYWDEEPTQDE